MWTFLLRQESYTCFFQGETPAFLPVAIFAAVTAMMVMTMVTTSNVALVVTPLEHHLRSSVSVEALEARVQQVIIQGRCGRRLCFRRCFVSISEAFRAREAPMRRFVAKLGAPRSFLAEASTWMRLFGDLGSATALEASV